MMEKEILQLSAKEKTQQTASKTSFSSWNMIQWFYLKLQQTVQFLIDNKNIISIDALLCKDFKNWL